MPKAKSKRRPARGAPAGAPTPSSVEAMQRIWAVVAALPRGSVASYGEVAMRAGLPGRARLVGRALRLAPRRPALPWHRVITASGRPAFPVGSPLYEQQRRRLEREGVRFVGTRVPLAAAPRASLDRLLWDRAD